MATSLETLLVSHAIASMTVISTTIKHLARSPIWDHEKPYYLTPLAGTGEKPATNFITEDVPVSIEDLRGLSTIFSHDGFVHQRHSSSYVSEGTVDDRTRYKQEVDKLLCDRFPGAILSHCYNLTVSRFQRIW